jgi:hydrogenase maturation protein HypF
MEPVPGLQRLHLSVSGAVQGVGFRPFVYRLAHELGLAGWIANDPAGVTIEVEGGEDGLALFTARLREEAPPRAHIHGLAARLVERRGDAGFRIVESAGRGARTAVVLPDLATCADCVADIDGADARRTGYAFTNCTNCGPRFSIIRSLPYDRPNTTMAGFVMCAACRAEYDDPRDRRFHAQPNACPRCGPRLELWDEHGARLDAEDPLQAAAEALQRGGIVAVKGIGGFHLMADATSSDAVTTLRRRKRRPTKPLAVMAASVDQVRRFAVVSAEAAELLASAEAPIVLLPRRTAPASRLADGTALLLAQELAPHNPTLGVMLAATPLHHLLLQHAGRPLVATSGNLAEEPICTDEREALARLAGIADFFLVHDRPIERHVDDSVADVLDGEPRLLRRARGYAPLPVRVASPLPCILAVGPHMKNTVALSRGAQVFVSQHIGDLDAVESQAAFESVAADFLRLYDAQPAAIAHDMHPDYASTPWARAAAARRGVPAIAVQHHHAHLVACMAEHGRREPTFGIIWDGTGFGPDGTIWGGEFLLGDASGFTRTAHLLPFRLPGSEAAVREPRRVAAALLHGACGADALDAGDHAVLGAFGHVERRALRHMIETGLGSPLTSSAGRLFDGMAAILGLCGVATFEGEPAIRLEHAADAGEHGAYLLPQLAGEGDEPVLLDWRPMVAAVVEDLRRDTSAGTIAARIHNAMIDAMLLQAELAGCDTVALSGGCFQNRLLSSRAAAALRRRGFHVLMHRQVPPGDGGVALGQVMVAAQRIAGSILRAGPAAAATTSIL